MDFIRRVNICEKTITYGGAQLGTNHLFGKVLTLFNACPETHQYMQPINREYNKHRKLNFDKEFQTKVTEYFTDHFKEAEVNFNMPLQRSMRKDRDSKRPGKRTRRHSAFTRTRSADPNTEQNQRLVNDKKKTLRWERPTVSAITPEGEIIPELSSEYPSSDESSVGDTEDELADTFQVEEPPSVNNVTAKYCELCNGSVDHETLECKKLDPSNRSEAENRKINLCKIKYREKLSKNRMKKGMPPLKRSSTTPPPTERPPLPRQAIIPKELPTPKVSTVSEEQKEAFKNSDLTDEELSTQDPLQGTWAFDENADYLQDLETLIKDQAQVSDDEVSTPYPKFNQPFVTRNSIDMEQKIYVPIDCDSEDDFDQEDYNAYGHSDPSLKNF